MSKIQIQNCKLYWQKIEFSRLKCILSFSAQIQAQMSQGLRKQNKKLSFYLIFCPRICTQCSKITKKSHFIFQKVLAFFTDFCPINIDLSGNTVWAQVLGYQKDTFRSQWWMRLFLQFPNTVYAAQFYWIWQIRQEIVCTLFTEEIKGQTHFAIIIILSKN